MVDTFAGVLSLFNEVKHASSSLFSPGKKAGRVSNDDGSSFSLFSSFVIVDSDVVFDDVEIDVSKFDGGNAVRFQVKHRSFHFSKLSEQINGPRGIN